MEETSDTTDMKNWRRIECPINELRLDLTLACGQSFRWRETCAGEWMSVLMGRVWRLRQTDTHVLYQVFEPAQSDSLFKTKSVFEPAQKDCGPNTDNRASIRLEENSAGNLSGRKNRKRQRGSDNSVVSKVTKLECGFPCTEDPSSYESILRDYFQLNVCLKSLYSQWSKSDEHFKKVASDFSGIRILRQDPVENLFSFICSSNNHISRIGGMVEKLCETYGEKLLEIDGLTFYGFPSVRALAQSGVEQTLRQLGFGYRAKYISDTARYIVQHHDDDWLYSLRNQSYEQTHSELIKLTGVGAKVADCVCLMSMDKPSAIPVDTHVWQIAKRDYHLAGTQNNKTLTNATYKAIGDHFRNLWGPYAGWAHSVLFSADLKKFQDLKTDK